MARPLALFLLMAATASGFQGSSPAPVQPPVRVFLDEAHDNFHTATSGYAAYARLLRQHGFAVNALTTRIASGRLAEVDLLIMASGRPGPREAVARQAVEAGEPLNWSVAASTSAYSSGEIAAIEAWVREGGSLLLVVDHAPAGGAGAALAAAFDVEARNSHTSDSAFAGATALLANAGHFLFTRPLGRLGDHPIMEGVDNVLTYTGCSLGAPPGATVLLRLPDTAVDRVWNAGAKRLDTIPAARRAQAVALEHGRGRVVVLAEAGMLTTNPGTSSDSCGTRGIAQTDLGNRRFALNVARWLARRPIDRGEVAFTNSGCRAAAAPGIVLAIDGAGSSAFIGNWTATVPGFQSAVRIELNLDGNQLSGELLAGGQPALVVSGSIDGPRLAFSVKSPNAVRTIVFTGTLEGDTIRFVRDVQVPPGGPPGGTGIFGAGGPKAFTATRDKK